MKESMDRAWRWLAVKMGKHAGVVSVIGLIITLIMGFGLTKLEFATDQDAYLNEGDQVLTDSKAYQDLFGGQAMLAAIRIDEGTTLEEFVSPENQKIFQEVEDTLRGREGIKAVATPLNTLVLSDRLIQKAPPTADEVKQLTDGNITADDLPTEADPTKSIAGASLFGAADAAKSDGNTEEASAREEDTGKTAARLLAIPAADRNLDNLEWRKFLIYDNAGEVRESLRPFFPNAQTAQIVTRLDGNMSIEDEGAAAVFTTTTIDDAGERLSPSADVTVVGSPTLLKDINDYLRGGILTLGAIAVAFMVLILLVLFDVRWRLLPLGIILIGVTWAFGLAGYLGIPLSLVTISGLPVMLGIGIDYAIQMHSRIEEEVLLDREDHPIQEAAVNLGPALLVVTFDAVFAFVALQFAKVPMIRDFGLLLAIGIAVICLVSIIGPLAALGAREYKSPTSSDKDFSEGWLGRFVVKIGSLPPKLAVPFAAVSILIFLGGIAVESSLEIQSDPIDWVNQSSETIQKIDIIKEQTKSSSELGIYVSSDDVFDQETVDFVHEFAYRQLAEETFTTDEGETKPALLTASSIVTTVSGILNIPGATPEGAVPRAPNADLVEAAWNVAPESLQEFTATSDAKNLNLIFRVGYTSLSDGEAVVKSVRSDVKASSPGDVKAVPSGLAVVGVGLLENIESNRILLTYLAIAFVGLFLAVRLRSLVRSVLSLVPVLIATGMASLVAFALGLKLSPMTAVGGPLIVAICTEFTSLMLLRFVEERKRGLGPQAAADTAAARTGRAFIVSALTGVAGVAVIATSPLPLLRDFGAIVALNVIIALAAALVILPPMLVWADDERREWVSRHLVDEELLAISRDGDDERHSLGEPIEGPKAGDGAVQASARE
ncbi:MAG: MMPL family transporter [Microthrixaceae bacterium]